MGKRKLKTVFWVFLLLIVTGLIGCKQKEPEKEQLCHIVMEKGDGYQVTDPVRTIKSGSDVSFTVTLDNNWQLLGTDYHGETEVIKDDDGNSYNRTYYTELPEGITAWIYKNGISNIFIEAMLALLIGTAIIVILIITQKKKINLK